MNREYPVRSDQTLTVIQLHQNVTKIAAIIRHSEQFYGTTPSSEPFMGLTPAGMEDAVKLGQNFLSSPLTRLYSSPFGRWIETAYLIDRGFTRQSVRPALVRKPVMTAFILLGVYWQAARIFLKKIPYVPYVPRKKELS